MVSPPHTVDQLLDLPDFFFREFFSGAEGREKRRQGAPEILLNELLALQTLKFSPGDQGGHLAVFRFENNVTATLVSGCYVGRTEPLSVRPNCGLMIALRDMVLDYRLRNNMIIKTPTEVRDIAAKKDQTYRLDRAFLDAVRSGDPSGIRSPYGDAIKSLRLGFAANRSMETGEVVAIESL